MTIGYVYSQLTHVMYITNLVRVGSLPFFSSVNDDMISTLSIYALLICPIAHVASFGSKWFNFSFFNYYKVSNTRGNHITLTRY